MNFWWNYPISKAVRFLEHTGWRLFGHVWRIGPIAICIMWRKPIDKIKVKAVRTSYRGFEYYCHIIANDGRVIGTANVDSLKCPVLDIEKEAARKNAMPKANQRKKRTKQLGD